MTTDLGTGWCPECRAHRPIVDQHHEGEQTRAGETGYQVTEFDCGHETESPRRIVAPAPGEPYAGQHRRVAASTRPRDLRAAREADLALADPFYVP